MSKADRYSKVLVFYKLSSDVKAKDWTYNGELPGNYDWFARSGLTGNRQYPLYDIFSGPFKGRLAMKKELERYFSECVKQGQVVRFKIEIRPAGN